MIIQTFVYFDCSTNANYVSWCSPISSAFSTFGWVQTADTGQVMWTSLSIVATQGAFSFGVTGSSPSQTVTCPYNTMTGITPIVGRSLAITGFTGTNTVLNSTFQVTSATAVTSTTGVFTFVYTGATALSGTLAGTPVVTAYASAPAANSTSNFELWGMGDNTGLSSPFYLKIVWGVGSTTAIPYPQIQFGTSTSGSGGLSGNTGTDLGVGNYSGGGAATLVEFDLSGGIDWFCCFLARNTSANSLCRMMAVERSRSTSGVATSTYITYIIAAAQSANNNCYQQSLFASGVGTVTTLEVGTGVGGFATVLPVTSTTGTVNNTTMLSPIYPLVGYIDNPHLMTVVGLSADWIEGTVIPVSLYNSSHNYLYSAKLNNSIPVGNQRVGFPAIRWE